MNKKRNEVIKENEVSDIYTFNLSGYPQKVLIEGKNKSLPVLITLHGGPGTPIPFSVGCRGLFPDFTNNFLMVYWDQLGCGINNYEIDDSFSITHFVKMTCDLIDEVKKLFPDNKVFIFGTSWGSILSLLVSDIKGREIAGVIVSGQILKNALFCGEVYKTLEENNVPQKIITRIKNVDIEKITVQDLQFVSSCLRKYTDAYINKKSKNEGIWKIISGLLISPDYGLRDFKAIIINGYKKNISLWKEILHLDLSAKLANVKIPYSIIQGETDVVASTTLVRNTVLTCGNNNLTLDIIKNNGHIPGKEMMDAVLNRLLELRNTLC
jgi:pimeloyl-ACP methyl ester carboxylesterase